MNIRGILWLPEIRAKIVSKHAVQPDEVEEVLKGRPHVRFVHKGHRRGEDVYAAMGRTAAGRLLIVFFIRKLSADALIVSARDMDGKERRLYEQA
jgi:uncharacterized DUF497 family protein